ncbi:MAG: hypothetical protein HKN14_12890 [Marinicaulis sp.]|nr:hypothetical protein [Marinicaulis sp.]NNE41801.1 hypothetical protein [Marinicaulis sp.]
MGGRGIEAAPFIDGVENIVIGAAGDGIRQFNFSSLLSEIEIADEKHEQFSENEIRKLLLTIHSANQNTKNLNIVQNNKTFQKSYLH